MTSLNDRITEASDLLPAESLALTVALAQVQRGDVPEPNGAVVCIYALARLTGRDAAFVEAARSAVPELVQRVREVVRKNAALGQRAIDLTMEVSRLTADRDSLRERVTELEREVGLSYKTEDAVTALRERLRVVEAERDRIRQEFDMYYSHTAPSEAGRLRDGIRALAEEWETLGSHPVPDSPMRDWATAHAASLRSLLEGQSE